APPAPHRRAPRRQDCHHAHRPAMGRTRLAHHRRRAPRVVSRNSCPRAPPCRTRSSIRCLTGGSRTQAVMIMVVARKGYSGAEVAEMLGYGLSKTKFLVISGQIRSVKDGRYRRILPEWVDDYIRRVAEDQIA